MKVGIATADWSESFFDADDHHSMGGSGWIRIGQYLRYWNVEHVEGVLVYLEKSKAFAVQTWDKEIHENCDVVLMQRWMDRTIPDQITEARSNGQVIVQDIDDWYWGLSTHNKAFKTTHPKYNPQANVNHYKKILARSNYVIVSTPYLADRLKQFIPGAKLVLHKNYVCLDDYKQRTHHDVDKPKIGWVGSTAHRSNDLAITKSFAKSLITSYEFHHTGHYLGKPEFKHYADKVGLERDEVSTNPMVLPRELGTTGFNFDIGLVPLQDIPFNQAKSWIKGIEYVAAGIPFVASPLPEYRRLKEEYGIGRLAKSASKWMHNINQLKDASVRQEEADRQFEAVQALDAKIGAKELENILIAAS